ncbi:hypothetical protein HYZ41_00550 [archaeon]|nr:hypothetical protein [archaeon]
MSEYTTKFAKEIMEGFKEKGWNLYNTDNVRTLGPDENIRRSLAESLELGSKYVLLPVVDDPRDPGQVMNKLDLVAQQISRKIPTIKIGGKSYPLMGFTLEKEKVKLHDPSGTPVDYPVFVGSIKSFLHA